MELESGLYVDFSLNVLSSSFTVYMPLSTCISFRNAIVKRKHPGTTLSIVYFFCSIVIIVFSTVLSSLFSLKKKKRWNWMHLTGKTGSCVYRKVRELMSNDRQRGFDSGCWRRPTTSVLFPHDRTRKYYQLGWRWLPVLRQRLATTTDNVRLTL